jgi:4-aminobutyrate aminotransferase-like enzyme
MPDGSKQTPATDAVRALAQFLHEPETDDLPQKEIVSELRAAGVNMERVKQRYESVLAEAEGRAVLAKARMRRQVFADRLTKLRERLPEVGDVRAQIREFVQEVFGNRPEAAVAWRNFDEATDEDLRTMLEDLTLLDELEKDDSSSSSS